MVRLTRIYTRTGDAGETALGDGSRVAKTAPRLAAMGAVDEANAAVGLARLEASALPEADAMLARIQNDLFDLGADLCCPPADGEPSRLRIAPTQVERLEAEIDRMNAVLAPLASFVLPGGSRISAQLHLARTIVRRAEREAWALAGVESVGEPALRYLNRLSDHLFVFARWANHETGRPDELWVPGQSR
jgi:cob(I)alamin adenosyltransferase